MDKCNVDGCEKPRFCKGWCMKHYARMQRHGSLTAERKKRPPCRLEGCSEISHGKGLCQKHYVKQWRSGTLKYQRLWDGKAKERSRVRTAKWKKDNWDYYKACLANRKQRLRQATPRWVDKKDLIAFYKNRPEGHHVDHIVPINGKEVSGLHVLWNLQYLPASENMSKGRRI